MQELELVGFTTDRRGLIYRTGRGTRSESFVVPVTESLRELVQSMVDPATGRIVEEPEIEEVVERSMPSPQTDSALPVREIQGRLRAGASLAQVAKLAGVDEEWIQRFASPVQAELRQVVERALSMHCQRPRAGTSALPLREAVAAGLVEKEISFTERAFADAWTSRLVGDDRWEVSLTYVQRGRTRSATWEFDVDADVLEPTNRLGVDLGMVGEGEVPAGMGLTVRGLVGSAVATPIRASDDDVAPNVHQVTTRSRTPASTGPKTSSGGSNRPGSGRTAVTGHGDGGEEAATTSSTKTRATTKASVEKKVTTRTAAKKRSTKKAASTKTSTKKRAAKKAPAKKTSTKKRAAKKAPAKKTSTKKRAAKKTSTKKRAAKTAPVESSSRTAGGDAPTGAEGRGAEATATASGEGSSSGRTLTADEVRSPERSIDDGMRRSASPTESAAPRIVSVRSSRRAPARAEATDTETDERREFDAASSPGAARRPRRRPPRRAPAIDATEPPASDVSAGDASADSWESPEVAPTDAPIDAVPPAGSEPVDDAGADDWAEDDGGWAEADDAWGDDEAWVDDAGWSEDDGWSDAAEGTDRTDDSGVVDDRADAADDDVADAPERPVRRSPSGVTVRAEQAGDRSNGLADTANPSSSPARGRGRRRQLRAQ